MPTQRTKHGTRACYFSCKCRCRKCSAANAAYQRQRRQKDWRGLVPATDAKEHIKLLSQQHVGSRALADATGLDRRTLNMISSGRVQMIQSATELQILSTNPDARADASLVRATSTWQRLNRILKEGLSKTELARRLGSKARVPQIQFKPDFITARNEMKVRRLYDRMYHDHDIGSRREGDSAR